MNTNSPRGMKSQLPDISNEIVQIKNEIEEVFSKWGYKKIITPLLEYYDILKIGVGEKNKQELYKLIDREGNVLALKSEMTAPIARTVANRISEINFPAKYSYFSPVYRFNQDQQGKNREIYQMGVEFIGDNKITADAEMMILAIEAVKASGINEFEFDIGHVKYLEGVFSEFNLNKKEQEKVKSFLNKRNVVGLRKYLQQFEKNNLLEELLLLRGGNEIFSRVRELTDNRLVLNAIKNLEEVYEFLKDYGIEKYINFDLSLIRGFNYYTGIVFEAFSQSFGYMLCGGGRYDNLIEKFSNKHISAVGFALGVERIRLVLKSEGINFNNKNKRATIVFTKENRKEALNYLQELHSQNNKAFMYMLSTEDLKNIEEKKSLTNIILEKYTNEEIDKLILFLDNKESRPEIIELNE